jgi:hypothetical protein
MQWLQHTLLRHSHKIIHLVLGLTVALTFAWNAEALEEDTSEYLPPYLFTTLVYSGVDKPVRQDPTIVRSHLVDINFDLLPNHKYTAEPGDEIPLILNFFSGIEFTVLIDKIRKNRSGSYSWYGKLKDIPMSQVILVVKKNMVFGNISKPNFTYQIRHITNKIHAVYEIDPSKFPPTSEPITPNIKSPLSSGKNQSNQNPSSKSGIGYDTQEDSPLEDTTTPNALNLEELSSAQNPRTQADDGSVIDVLFVYTEEARIKEGGTMAIESLIDLTVSVTNAAYSNSGVGHIIREVGKKEINFPETGFTCIPGTQDFSCFSNFLASAQNGSIPGLHALRDANNADLVAVLVVGDFTLCGIAYFMGPPAVTVASFPAFAPFGYSVTATNCAAANLTVAHEVGHNMSARHDRANDNKNTPFSFNHGYIDSANGFQTIMGASKGPDTRIQYFSNPNILFNGSVTGIAEGSALAADNRLTFQKTAFFVSNFRQIAPPAFNSIVSYENSKRVVSPYWQSDDSSYSFIAVSHPSLSTMASQIGVTVRAIRNNGTLFGSATSFTIGSSVTKRIFIVRSTHPNINKTSLVDAELITGSSAFQHGFLHLNPVASNPEISVGGYNDITMLSFWGAVVIEKNTTGFAMEFVGDTHDSAATSTIDGSATVSGVN